MLTMIRDGHRQVGIYQQKVSQIGSRHYSRVARESIDPSSFLFSIAFHRRRGRFSLTSQRIDTTFPRWIHRVDLERPISPKRIILSRE